MFEVAIYTDARAAEAIDGVDGFNFVAVSAGMTAQDRQVVRSHLLHRVVAGWGVDHDPLDHPPTFAYYRHGDRYYVSRGISTGLTNNGRPGNLLTEAAVTTDPDDFGDLCPAQLFGAVNWSLTKVTGTLPAWPGPLQVTPDFEADALRRMVTDDPWATEHLAELLAMVEQVREGRRLVLVASDAVTAQRWIALGTLFMEGGWVRDLTIRGLVQDPMTTKADIVAGSPQLGPQPDPRTPRTGVNVVDLDQKLMSAVEVTESARTQAGWFLHEEPGTALAAVDLARRWEPVMGRDTATRAAAVALFPRPGGLRDDWVCTMQALKGLAERDEDDDLFLYADSLLDVAVTYAPASRTDAVLAAETLLALLDAGSMEVATGVLVPTLEAVSRQSEAAEAWLTAVGSAHRAGLAWADRDARQQASRLLSALAAETEPGLAAPLLSAAGVLNLPLDEPARDRVTRLLAEQWSRSPRLSGQHEHWRYGEEVVQLLADTLVARWSTGDQASLAALQRGDWTWLGSCRDLTARSRGQVGGWLAAGEVAALPVAQRAQALQTVRGVPEQSWELVWSGAQLPRDAELLRTWAAAYRGLSWDAGAEVYRLVQDAVQRPEPAVAVATLLESLTHPGVLVDHPGLRRYAERVARSRGCCRCAVRSPEVPNPYLSEVLRDLPEMTWLLLDQIGEILVTVPDRRGAADLARQVGPVAEKAVREALSRRLASDPDIGPVLHAALTVLQERHSAPARGARTVLLQVCDSREEMARVEQAVEAGRLTMEDREAFEVFEKEARRGRLGRRITQVASGLLGGKGKDE